MFAARSIELSGCFALSIPADAAFELLARDPVKRRPGSQAAQ